MERAVMENFVSGHTTTILDRLHQILASSHEKTTHGVLHRFAPYTARAMTAWLSKAFAVAVAKGVPFQIRDLFERCGPLIVAQARANV
jgi:hypothetical protein